MATDSESFNADLYNLLKVRGYKPTPLNSKNQRVGASQEADVIEFTFSKDSKDYGKVWASIDNANKVTIYYDEEQAESPSQPTPGVDYDDSWTGLLKHIKNWAQRRQLSFELANKDRLSDDMRQRDYYKMKAKIAESYHPMGKKASYNDAVPNVKIVIQHSRALEEGEQRFRNIAKIYLENVDGERFLAPTTRPGIARVYARHIAEGGLPNDERWGHIKSICEEYNKMAGFVRATRNKQFNESAQKLVNEGINHYSNLRETLTKMTGHRGYNAYFESWTPALMEEEGDTTINELFVQETLDPRIESVMPILSRLRKRVSEMSEVKALGEWADDIISEKLEISEEQVEEASKKAPWEKEGEWSKEQKRKGADYTIVKPKDSKKEEKVDESSEERPYVCVHAKKGKCEVTGKSSYDAAQKAAKKWNLKSTAGIDAHLADTTHKTSEIGEAISEEQDHDPYYYKIRIKTQDGITKDYAILAKHHSEAIEKAKQEYIKKFPNAKIKDVDVVGTYGKNLPSFSGTRGKTAIERAKEKARKKLKKKEIVSPADIDEGKVTPVPSGHKGLNPQQKRVGQVPGTEKARTIKGGIGKPNQPHPFQGRLVGASESVEHDELARIAEMAGIKKSQN